MEIEPTMSLTSSLRAGGIGLFLLFVLLLVTVPPAHALDCLACHETEPTAKQRTKAVSLYVNGKMFQSSVHAAIGCQGCHSDVKGFPHTPKPRMVSCASCHADQATAYDESVHAKVTRHQKLAYPACLNCHGNPHGILAVNNPRSRVYPLNLPRTCGTCHANPALAKRYGLPNVYAMYIDSIHGLALTRDGLLVAATCTSCHGSHRILSRTNPHSQIYRTNVPTTCGTCHAGVKAAYLEGIHGKAMKEGEAAAPVCTDCHTAHRIRRVAAPAWQVKTVATCGRCHKEQLHSYRDTFHGQVTALGFVATARCWSCHGMHRILPASDPRSTIAPANLLTTCRKCHTNATESFTSYQPHPNPRDKNLNPGLYYASHFMNFLLLGVFVFFGVHMILWLMRSGFGDRKFNWPGKGKPPAPRKESGGTDGKG